MFETTIRSLGGLLSAYDLSMDYAFLEKADDLGSRLLRAFDSPSGIPYGQVHLGTGVASNIAWIKNSALLAEYSTLQVEFRYLAKVTGDREYAEKSERIFDILEKLQPNSGLLSLQTSNLQKEARQRGSHVSFGAMGDRYVPSSHIMVRCDINQCFFLSYGKYLTKGQLFPTPLTSPFTIVRMNTS